MKEFIERLFNGTRQSEEWEEVLAAEREYLELQRVVAAPGEALREAGTIDSRFVERMAELVDELPEIRTKLTRARETHRKALCRYRSRWGVRNALLGWGVLLLVGGLNYWLFSLAGTDYVIWYVENGALLSLIFGLFVVTLELDRITGLVAADPVSFLAGVADLQAYAQSAWAGLSGERLPDSSLEATDASIAQTRHRSLRFDHVVWSIVAFGFIAAVWVWGLVVAPLQYWVHLICGAPARVAMSAANTTWFDRPGNRFERFKKTRRTTTIHFISRIRPPTETAVDIGIGARPVRLTLALSAIFLFALARIV